MKIAKENTYIDFPMYWRNDRSLIRLIQYAAWEQS